MLPRCAPLLVVTLACFSSVASTMQQSAPSSTTPTGSVSGIVLDGRGKALPDVTVYAVPETDVKKQFHTKTNGAGEFMLPGLPDGPAYLSAYKESDGYPYDFFSFFAARGTNTPLKIQIKASEEIKDIRIRLGEKAARLDIEIVTEDGKALEKGATLFFTRPDQPERPYNRGARSTESLLVPAVPFHLAVQADGYKVWHCGGNPNGLLSLNPSETFLLSVRLERLQ